MLINVSGQHFEVTPALKKYAEDKIKKLEEHFKTITQVHLVLSVEHKIHQKVKAELHLAGGTIEASADTENMYASIDAIKDKLDSQIKKHKEKMLNRKAPDLELELDPE